MSTTTELNPLPCPFCGNDASVFHNEIGNGEYIVRCERAVTCGSRGSAWLTEKDAISAWNRRSAAHGEPSKAGEWNAAIEAAAHVCWSMQARPEFEPEFHDKMLKQAEERIRALSSAPAQAAQSEEAKKLLDVLIDARQALQYANKNPGGGIDDTIWMMGRPETLFDFLDAAIEDAMSTTPSTPSEKDGGK